jgi:CheY-like chemotaxis protein
MENDRPLCGFVVLVVEDDADTRESLTALIREGLGCRVLSASSGCEALEIIDSKVRVDLVFSDIMMPAMDGLTLIDEVRKRLPQIPIVLATGMTTVLDDAMERGAIALVKPYTLDSSGRSSEIGSARIPALPER